MLFQIRRVAPFVLQLGPCVDVIVGVGVFDDHGCISLSNVSTDGGQRRKTILGQMGTGGWPFDSVHRWEPGCS